MTGRAEGKRHPTRLWWVAAWVLLPSLAGCGTADGGEPAAEGAVEDEVRPGIEVLLEDSIHLMSGRRVGLITNQTGVDRMGTSSIDRLMAAPEVELVALFSPEHGIRGAAEAGARLGDERDERTGLPIFSLYGETLEPTPPMLEGVEVLVFDIQDIGARYYTYVSTMARAMRVAGERGLPFVVLDRPNPIGGEAMQGNILDPAYSTFVGMYPVPMRHGMTPGELARLYVGEFGVEVELHVVPATGWTREMRFEETGLPWIAPSPNMPDTESALHYPGTCLFEGTNLSVGRGTDRPFQWVGSPWIDGEALAARLQEYGLPGVRFEAVRFTPRSPGDGKYADEEVGGVRLVATGPDYDPTVASVAVLVEARAQAGDRWEWRVAHFDRLAGTDGLRLGIDAGMSVEELVAGWDEGIAGFEALASRYLIYP